MWLMTQHGFLSVVEDRGNSERVMVRSRDRQSLEHFAKSLGFDDARIIELGFGDYRYRVFCSKPAFAGYAAETALNIDYTNYKSRLQRSRGTRWHDVAMSIWGKMHDISDPRKTPVASPLDTEQEQKRRVRATAPVGSRIASMSDDEFEDYWRTVVKGRRTLGQDTDARRIRPEPDDITPEPPAAPVSDFYGKIDRWKLDHAALQECYRSPKPGMVVMDLDPRSEGRRVGLIQSISNVEVDAFPPREVKVTVKWLPRPGRRTRTTRVAWKHFTPRRDLASGYLIAGFVEQVWPTRGPTTQQSLPLDEATPQDVATAIVEADAEIRSPNPDDAPPSGDVQQGLDPDGAQGARGGSADVLDGARPHRALYERTGH